MAKEPCNHQELEHAGVESTEMLGYSKSCRQEVHHKILNEFDDWHVTAQVPIQMYIAQY
jgi:hypothetical protein